MALAEVPRRVRVVLADDASEIRLLVRLGLQLDGRFEVVAEAGDGDEAVKACTSHQPDIAVLDLAMPVMDGLQALPLIRESSPGTRVVVLSAFSSHQMAAEARTAGADAYLEKGAATDQLVSVLAGLAGLGSPAPRPGTIATQPDRPAAESPTSDNDSGLREVGVPSAHRAAIGLDEAVELRVSEILDVVRHELRTPLVITEGFSALLSDALDAGDMDAAYERLEDIDRNLGVLQRLLTVLASVDDIDDQTTFALTRVDLTALLHELTADFAAIAPDHKVVVAVPQRIAVMAEPGRLTQVLTNLVSNAAKFSTRGMTIEVTVVSVRGCAEIAVRDHGEGVPVGHEEFVFTRFGRLARDRGAPGLGLGLHLSRRIARAFGGDLVLQHPEGRGARFVVRLPLSAEEPCE